MANTCRSRLPKLSNVKLTWPDSCPRVLDPGKSREDGWRAWYTRSCFMQLWSEQVPSATMLSRKAVFGTERCGAENSLSIPSCVDECCVDPGERPANRLIGEGRAGDLSAPQGAHLCDKPTGNRSREGRRGLVSIYTIFSYYSRIYE